MGSAPPSRAAAAISAARLRSFTLRFELGHKIMPIKLAPARAACDGRARARQQPDALFMQLPQRHGGATHVQRLLWPCDAANLDLRGARERRSAPHVKRRVTEAFTKAAAPHRAAACACAARRRQRTVGTLGAAAAAQICDARRELETRRRRGACCANEHRPAAPAADMAPQQACVSRA